MSGFAVFLNHDGTINRGVHYLSTPANLELREQAGRAIRELNDANTRSSSRTSPGSAEGTSMRIRSMTFMPGWETRWRRTEPRLTGYTTVRTISTTVANAGSHGRGSTGTRPVTTGLSSKPASWLGTARRTRRPPDWRSDHIRRHRTRPQRAGINGGRIGFDGRRTRGAAGWILAQLEA